MSKIPFSIDYRPQIESGEYRVETQAGCPVRIVCWDMVCELPILGLVLLNDEKAEEMAVGFTYEGTNLLGESLYDKLFIVTQEEEMTEFESNVRTCITENLTTHINDGNGMKMSSTVFIDNDTTKKLASELLALAREQFIKDGYVIEKKIFHDAVEKIEDNLENIIDLEYFSRCEVENATSHVIMNWDEFRKLAQKFINIGKNEALKDIDGTAIVHCKSYDKGYDDGKKEALKDLPRWREWDNGAAGNSEGHPIALVSGAGGIRFVSVLGAHGEKYIMLDDLKKLPGFKED